MNFERKSSLAQARVWFAALSLLASTGAWARCKTNGLMVFPAPGAVIPTNSRMIIEGLGTEQQRVSSLVGRELVLRATDDVVTVKVLLGWRSAMNRVAVVLKPNHALRPDKTYALMIDSQLPSYLVLNDGSPETISWRTGQGSDEQAPRYQLKPAISEGSYAVDGDGVSRFLKIHTTLVEESPAYFVVTLRRARGSSASQTYFVPLNGGEAQVGHDGCSGGFSFDDGRAYKAVIEAFDSPGNAARRLAPIELQAPRPIRQ